MYSGQVDDSPSTPHVRSTSNKASSKKRASPIDEVDNSAIREAVANIQDCADHVKAATTRLVDEELVDEELDQAIQLLQQDGIVEGSEWYVQALIIFTEKSINRRVFLRYCGTPQVRIHFLVEKWRFMKKKNL